MATPPAHSTERGTSESPDRRDASDGSGASFPIVAIGASAGGLAALETFFDHVPRDAGVAFVIVMHLSPEHESLLDTLLQPHVTMPVQQVTEPVRLEPNRVYIIPPNANLEAIDTTCASAHSRRDAPSARRSTTSSTRWRSRTAAMPSA